MRVCVVYDCLFPHTVGGAERWYRELALQLAADGHAVTYLTRKQWDDGDSPQLPGVRVIPVSPGGPLYTADGRRTIGPPLRFGLGVLRHLLRNRRSYDAVHLCSFPYFSLLAARLALAGTPARIGVDWFEVWTLDYWRGYLGRIGGRIGWLVQRLCARLTPQAFVFSRVHAERLLGEGLRRPALRLAGLYRGPLEPAAAGGERAPLVVFAGRHIPEKRAEVVPAAVAAARKQVPGLRGLVLGDGPERERVLAAIAAAGVEDVVEAPGFVSGEDVSEAFARATCMLLPSSREGYGMVVIEAAALGTPSVVVAGADNAAAELIEEDVNGFVAPATEPRALATAIVACHAGGAELRERTAAWFARRAPELTVDASAHAVARWYATAAR
ncbi:MAG TPA: glycosyltransferase [Thermoleophilaceae bacterium]|nr:glycosyltransferase [Thermoleophilaceae bacterium]